jgi:hypothetical protein
MSFRSATGKFIEWLDTSIAKKFSNFLFVDARYGSDPVMRRILSLARKFDYQSLLIEEIEEASCALLVEENAARRSRRPDFKKSLVHRLSFFKTPAGQTPGAEDFCGYVVYKRDEFADDPRQLSHVFECVMPLFRDAADNNFVHTVRTYQVNTHAGKFEVSGVLYAQQNDVTVVCAHVALRTALSVMLPEGDVTYARLNALVGVNHTTRKVGGGVGLRPDDLETVFNSLSVNFQKLVHEPSKNLLLPTEFQRDLYGFVESGCPALMGFELDQAKPGAAAPERHVIPVFGHTFNDDTWLPDAHRAYFGGGLSYYPSENWLSSFVVHDDNFGPYYCLPRSFLKKESLRIIYGLRTEAAPLSAVEAEAVGFDYLRAITKTMPIRHEDWYDRFVVFAQCGWLVLRTLVVRKLDYIAHLGSIQDWEGVGMEGDRQNAIANRLPESFWIVEASAPELFPSSRRKFGEVLFVSHEPFAKAARSFTFDRSAAAGSGYDQSAWR